MPPPGSARAPDHGPRAPHSPRRHTDSPVASPVSVISGPMDTTAATADARLRACPTPVPIPPPRTPPMGRAERRPAPEGSGSRSYGGCSPRARRGRRGAWPPASARGWTRRPRGRSPDSHATRRNTAAPWPTWMTNAAPRNERRTGSEGTVRAPPTRRPGPRGGAPGDPYVTVHGADRPSHGIRPGPMGSCHSSVTCLRRHRAPATQEGRGGVLPPPPGGVLVRGGLDDCRRSMVRRRRHVEGAGG